MIVKKENSEQIVDKFVAPRSSDRLSRLEGLVSDQRSQDSADIGSDNSQNQTLSKNEEIDPICLKRLQILESEKGLDEVQERNFNIQITNERAGNCSVRLVNENGDVVNLNDILPNGWKFILAPGFQCNVKAKEIGAPFDKADSIYFLIGLGHEIGHSVIDGADKRTSFSDKNDSMLDRIRTKPYSSWNSFLGRTNDKRDSLLTAQGQMQDSGVGFRLSEEMIRYLTEKPDWMKDNEWDRVKESERNSWAYSLHLLRGLAADGYQVFNGLNQGKLKDIISAKLFRYETLREVDKKILSDNRLESGDYKPLFRKGYEDLDTNL